MKLVVAEDGSELAADLWATPHRVASSILYPEGRAALAAARRLGRLTARAYGKAVEEFDAARGELVVIGIDAALAQDAGDLADERGLRGYDAVHLAGAIAFGADTTVVMWDRDLARAAIQVGCAVAPTP